MNQDIKHSDDPEGIDTGPPSIGKVENLVTNDAVFGNITENGPNYRNVYASPIPIQQNSADHIAWMAWYNCPDDENTDRPRCPLHAAHPRHPGYVPGNILIVTIAAITTWSSYMIGVFKIRHPEVYGIGDVGGMFFGRVGYELFGGAYALQFTFSAGSAMLSISIALNALSSHAVCTAIFVAVAAVAGFVIGSIRTLDRIGFLAWIGTICIITAVFVVTVGVGLQDRPSAAPQAGEWTSDYKLVNSPGFTDAISAVSSLVFTYTGTPIFFNIVSEMREPLLYPRALAVCQTAVTIVYIIVGTVVYYYCGSYVASPALGSAGDIVKKVSYGISLPGLIVSCVLFVHLPGKHIFVRILRGSDHLTSNSVIHWTTWLSSTFGVALVAYIVASAIPVFSGLISLIGALLGSFLNFHPYAGMWLYDNWKTAERTLKWKLMVAWCGFMLLAGTFLMVGGTYGAVVGIIETYQESGGSAAWSCADNSNSS